MAEAGCSQEIVARAAWQALAGEVGKELRTVLEKMVGIDPGVPSEIDGDSSCFYCASSMAVGENHKADCPYLEAKRLLGKEI